MRFSLKIFIFMFAIAFTVSGAAGSYFYYQSQSAMTRSIQSQLLTAAKSFSGLIPGDIIKSLTEPEDMHSDGYRRIQDILYQISQTSPDFRYAYTMRLIDGEVFFVVDSPPRGYDDPDLQLPPEAMPEPVGAHYPDAPQTLLDGFDGPSVDNRIYEDQWGWTISGYAPVLDSMGDPVGLLGIDMSAEHMHSRLNAISQAGKISLVVAALLAVMFTVILARHITRPIKDLHEGFNRISSGDLETKVPKRGRDELGELSEHFNSMLSQLREKKLLQTSLGKIMHQDVIKKFMKQEISLGGEIAEASVLFCDLRGFTGISEKTSPQKLVELLNSYFSLMVKAVEKHDGMVDKFVGDKIMAVFGHPQPSEYASGQALKAGMQMLKACDELNIALGPDLKLENSIGIHSGRVLAGNIGSQERMEYTVIGDVVNTAARLESATRVMDTRLAISESAARGIPDLPQSMVYNGELILQGRSEKTGVYILK